MMRKVAILLALAMAGACAGAATGLDLDAMLKHSQFDVVELSPDGHYLAATMPQDDREGLVVMRRSDSAVTTSFTLGKDEYIHDFSWINNKRLLIRVAEKIGALEQPQDTGQLYGLDFDQKTPDLLVGWATNGDPLTGGNKERVAALSVNKVPGDDHHVIITAYPYGQSERFNTAELLDVDTGRRTVLARSPIKSAQFFPDNAGVVRFAAASQKDNASKLWVRPTNDSDWKLINDEAVSGAAEVPLGFSTDNRIAYLKVQRASGPDAIVSYDTASGERKEVLRDALADPAQIVHAFDGNAVPVGAIYDDGIPHSAFFDPQGREARLYAMLEQAFQGSAVKVTSTTSDGTLMLVSVYSDRDPGKFYLFDTRSGKVEYLLSRRRWVDPKAMAQTQVLQIVARDGVPLRAYLTLPPGREARNLPLVVFPHGGPFTIYDRWHFDTDAQVLAAAGYAVLQVNYRGSGNYGKHFLKSGRRQWGGAMQDDLTDATEWTVAHGLVDRSRMCMYGASYGAYASLEGVSKEPALYKCAVGYVGVYDLPMLVAEEADKSTRLENWTRDWIGTDPAKLAEVSPDLNADRIKVPVFLVAGGEDRTAPIKHSEKMEAALKKAGVSVQTLYEPTEGHGFYTLEHRRDFYTRLLDFLDRNIGEKAKVAAAH